MVQVDDMDRISIEAEELVPFLDFLSLLYLLQFSRRRDPLIG